jgi:hypothetical protein
VRNEFGRVRVAHGRRICDFLSVVLLGTFGVFGFVAYSYTCYNVYVREEDVPGDLDLGGGHVLMTLIRLACPHTTPFAKSAVNCSSFLLVHDFDPDRP